MTGLFELGGQASEGLEILAEGGNTGPLGDELANHATEIQTVEGLLEPGQSVTTIISGARRHGFLSVAVMLIPTNDTFIAVNRMPLARCPGISCYSIFSRHSRLDCWAPGSR